MPENLTELQILNIFSQHVVMQTRNLLTTQHYQSMRAHFATKMKNLFIMTLHFIINKPIMFYLCIHMIHIYWKEILLIQCTEMKSIIIYQ